MSANAQSGSVNTSLPPLGNDNSGAQAPVKVTLHWDTDACKAST